MYLSLCHPRLCSLDQLWTCEAIATAAHFHNATSQAAMSRSVEPTLLSLLPTLPSASSLPQPLVDLASSLLAQSRHNASTLKAEEEVARVYACAHIACERLKTGLDLPPIQARPPVPPRIYKRLYTHLDHILPQSSVAKSGRIRTPSGKLREAPSPLGSGSTQRTRERATPSKETALAAFRSKGVGTPSKSTGKSTALSAQKSSEILPPWVKPTIRSICTQLDSDRMGRTVLAGVQTIVAPHGKRSNDAWIAEHLGSLVAAVAFMVTIKYATLETGKPISSEQYADWRKNIIRALRQARKDVDVKDQDEEIFWEGWTYIGPKEVDEAAKRFNENGWQNEDWFKGIRDQLGAGLHADTEMEDCEDAISASAHSQIQRGDTMLQGRWDMTERKRQEYSRWKAEILAQCDQIEKASGTMTTGVPA